MKRISIAVLLTIISTMTILSACGGGGGGGGGQAQPTVAVLKLATSGTGATIYGLDVTVNLPSGVTVKSTTNQPETDDGVVVASGVAASGTIATAVYTPATDALPGKVRILIANASGFTTGEFCTVNGDIAAGHSPKAADFSIENFSASDADGNVISGLTPGFTADIQ